MADAWNSWAIRCPQTLGFRMIQGQRTARLHCGSSSRLRTRRWGGAARGRRTRRRRIARCRRLRGSDWWGGPPCGERPKHQARRTTRQGAALAGGLAATNLAIVIHAASPWHSNRSHEPLAPTLNQAAADVHAASKSPQGRRRSWPGRVYDCRCRSELQEPSTMARGAGASQWSARRRAERLTRSS
jgi:hypothetical protein